MIGTYGHLINLVGIKPLVCYFRVLTPIRQMGVSHQMHCLQMEQESARLVAYLCHAVLKSAKCRTGELQVCVNEVV